MRIFRKSEEKRRRTHSKRQRRRASRLSLETLERREVMSATMLVVDFDGQSGADISAMCDDVSCWGFPASGELSFVDEFATLSAQYAKFSFLDYNADGQLDSADGEIAADRIMEHVQEDYAPYDVEVIREDDLTKAQSLMANSPTGDALIFVTGHHTASGGQAPLDIGNTKDNVGAAGGTVGVATSMAAKWWASGDAFINRFANIVSHEAGHTFGLKHVDGSIHPGFRSLMTSAVGKENLNFPNESVNTEGSLIQSAHQVLTDNLGSSPHAWAAVLEPGVLTIQGSSSADDVSIENMGGDWNVVLEGVSDHYVDPSDSPDLNSLNPFSQAISQITYLAGSGNDTLEVDDTITARVFAEGGAGDDLLNGGGGDDHLDGGAGDDSIFGHGGVDHLMGRLGDDRLDGGDDPDVLFGDKGADLLIGGDGNDSLHGGQGDDTLVAYIGEPMDYLWGSIFGLDWLFEESGNGNSLYGDAGNDVLFGGAYGDYLEGQSGMDQLFGFYGNDFLNGGAGDDAIFGGAGNDYLVGQSGDDRLHGGSGNDVLYGGAGGGDVLYGDSGTDRLWDSQAAVLEGGSGWDYVNGQSEYWEWFLRKMARTTQSRFAPAVRGFSLVGHWTNAMDAR